MARIIAGEAGSVPLTVPSGPTRPTSDRVKEALFSALEHRINLAGATIVDLYAGSGALGLEALSRGASKLIAVESHRQAGDVIRRNVATVRAALSHEAQVQVHTSTVSGFLATHPELGDVDVVFLDPPYDLSDESLHQVLRDLARLIGEHTLVIVERRRDRGDTSWPEGFALLSHKTYGDTQVATLELSR